MNSLQLAVTLHQKGFLSKEAMDEVLRVREGIIKEAILQEAGTIFSKARRGVGKAGGGFVSGLKRVIGGGGGLQPADVGKTPDNVQVLGNLKRIIAYAGLTAGASTGIHALTRHSKDKKLRNEIASSYNQMFDQVQDVGRMREKDPHGVQRTFEVLATYAPSLAASPLVAGAFVKQWAPMGMVDPTMIRSLAETQSFIDREHESKSPFHGKFEQGLNLSSRAMRG